MQKANEASFLKILKHVQLQRDSENMDSDKRIEIENSGQHAEQQIQND